MKNKDVLLKRISEIISNRCEGIKHLEFSKDELPDIANEIHEAMEEYRNQPSLDKSKLKDDDIEMEANLTVLVGSEVAMINRGIKSGIDWPMISKWLEKKIGLYQPSPEKEELRERFTQECVGQRVVKENGIPVDFHTWVDKSPTEIFDWFWNNLHPVIDGDDVRLNWVTQTNTRGLDHITSSASFGEYFCEIRHDSEPTMTKKGPVYQDEIAAHYWLTIKFRGVRMVEKHAAKLESLQEFCPKWLKQEVGEYVKKHLSNLPQKDRSISIKNFIRNKLQENEEHHEYAVATETVRVWIEEYEGELPQKGDGWVSCAERLPTKEDGPEVHIYVNIVKPWHDIVSVVWLTENTRNVDPSKISWRHLPPTPKDK